MSKKYYLPNLYSIRTSKRKEGRKITQKDIAKFIGKTAPLITLIETQQLEASEEDCLKIANFLNCSLESLIKNTEENNSLSAKEQPSTTEKTTDLNNDNLKLINFNDLKDAEVIDLIQAYKDNPDAIHEASFLEDLFDENVRYILKWKINTDLLAPDYNKNDPVFIVLGYETIIDQFGTFLLQNKNNLKLFRKIRQREDGIFEVITLADRQLYPNQEYTTREAMPFKILGKVEYALKKS